MTKRSVTNWIVIHCSATPPAMDIGVEEIDQWHRDKGWVNGVGYHFVVRRTGIIEAGRHPDAVGAHVRGHNHESVSICYVGGVDRHEEPKDNRTVSQFVAIRRLVAVLELMYPKAKVVGHRDFEGVDKACPSFDVETEL